VKNAFPTPEEFSKHTLPEILRIQADRLGEKQFLDVDGKTVSFAGMHRITSSLAHGMGELGVARSDRVAILLPNCLEMVITWFAAAKLGAIEVPNNVGLKGDLLVHNMNSCGAEILFACPAVLTEVASVQESLSFLKTVVLVGASVDDARAAGIRDFKVVTYEHCMASAVGEGFSAGHYSDPLAILYTSGTTGASKGVVMSHQHCFAWSMAMALNLGYTREDSYFSALPLFHTDAQMFGVYMALLFGTKSTLVEKFSASNFWGQVRASGASATNLLGAMAVILARQPRSAQDDLNPIRVCQCIPMVPDQVEFEGRYSLKLVTGYGQTETSFVTLDTADRSRPQSCGRAHPNWEVAIFDKFDEPVATGTVGEIVARPKTSWSMFSGYHELEAKTVSAIRNLWYHSGDAGCLDNDGWLYFKHRLTESIRRRGENISAYEVESIAGRHSDIVESAAFGVPSEFTEEDVMLVARREPGSMIQPQDLVAHFQIHAPRHMVPRYIEITELPLPRTPTEKISRVTLQRTGVSEFTFDREKHDHP
jgi:crotonobetaine/carnitine-CoA ligase